jgi:hypothetical protein
MSDYTIAAIPTLYRGRQYRSRLEARWAAFFDLLGWRHEYEPFDLGVWSPDFALRAEEECAEAGPLEPGLIEIKPIDGWHQPTVQKMAQAAKRRAFEGPLFLFGTAPQLMPENGFVRLGWQGNMWCDYDEKTKRHKLDSVRRWWTPAYLHWLQMYDRPSFVPDILHTSPHQQIQGGFFSDLTFLDAKTYAAHTMSLWARATNAVQYQHGGRA